MAPDRSIGCSLSRRCCGLIPIVAPSLSRECLAIIYMTKHTESATSEETGRRLTREEAREGAITSLAKDLYFVMERADPTTEYDWDRTLDENWEALLPHRQGFYVNAVGALLAREREILLAL